MEGSPSFNLVEVATVIQRRIKTIIGFSAIVTLLAAVLVFILPSYYASTATAVAGNPTLADKARLFNTNIEGLYSNFGSGDDLDRLYGIASLDTVLGTLSDTFNLVAYYSAKGSTKQQARRNAMLQLKDDLQIEKNELYQLKITAWHKDAQTAAALANTTLALVEESVQAIWQQSYRHTQLQLDSAIATTAEKYENLASETQASTTGEGIKDRSDISSAQRSALLDQIQQFESLSAQVKVARATSTTAVIVLEAATPAAKPTRPKKLSVIVTACLLSLLFGVIAALLYDRKQT